MCVCLECLWKPEDYVYVWQTGQNWFFPFCCCIMMWLLTSFVGQVFCSPFIWLWLVYDLTGFTQSLKLREFFSSSRF